MTSTRRFRATDILKFNNVNLDPLTETYNIQFYLSYLARWPNLFYIIEDNASSKRIAGYIMGKVEGMGKQWHGHVTAVTVAADYRRLGLARKMMDILESTSEEVFDAYFVDLFVRASNSLAINMYRTFGYSVYRRVVGYYSSDMTAADGEDAFDMRKPLKRDKLKQSVRTNGENYRVSPAEVW